jgi:hypothetical protein
MYFLRNFIIILRVFHFRWSEFLFCAETLCCGAVLFFPSTP